MFPIQAIIRHRASCPHGTSKCRNNNNLRPICCIPTSFPSALTPYNFGILNVRSIGNKSFIINDFIGSKDLDFFYDYIDMAVPNGLKLAPLTLYILISPGSLEEEVA